MGMFDWVNVEITCPNCSEIVKGFQSKDGLCRLNLIDPDEVNNFYSYCDNCKLWIEYHREESQPVARKSPFNEDEIILLGFKRTTEF